MHEPRCELRLPKVPMRTIYYFRFPAFGRSSFRAWPIKGLRPAGPPATMRPAGTAGTLSLPRTSGASRMTLPIAALLIAFTVVLVLKGMDVRLALFGCAISLGMLAQNVTPVIHMFFTTLCNEKFVVPICCAMGFAYVLKHTECDQHLVRLLTNPLRHVGFLLIPGVVLAAFIVNIPVISQTSTAVCLGAVVVPLMRAANLSNLTIGSTMVFGASIGGELLNPGAPELITVGNALGEDPKQVIAAVAKLLFPHLLIATAVFWWLRRREERGIVKEMVKRETVQGPGVNYLKAAVPILPLVLLIVTGPPLNLIHLPKEWLTSKETVKSFDTRLIGAAMIVGCIIAGLAAPRKLDGLTKSFFTGAGYALAEIVSLIVVANCFGEAIKQVGLTDLFGRWIKREENLLLPLAAALPCGFAALSGSGMASTSSLYELYVEPARHLGADPMDVGAMVSLGSAAGRTMSPFAAVVLMSAKLTDTAPFALVRRTCGPLLVGLVCVVILRSLGVI